MKQFARCSNCRQWYVEHAVTTVDILQGNGMRRTALWCQPCIRAAEQRSLYADDVVDFQDLQSPDDSLLSYGLLPPEEANGVLGELLQEHLDLMEEALVQEDDDAIASRIGDFMERGRTHLETLDDSEQAKRLTNHLNYWQIFLNTLNQSSEQGY
ncbi:MAG: hypothetical protein ETSY1_13215 [Candidatus Entotheonella factor]|uniref:Uncharacterized protein n=1 Tax=Entotheonella factor TaxID=1429438 RepID=W4LQA1_ENTF1|nr:hypothetical protein [Candidatus Entotheonella palauensis]ETW99895.1 MAG: hypothetical protein ETSY1_13215 [Candidatus Entotheonella factor]